MLTKAKNQGVEVIAVECEAGESTLTHGKEIDVRTIVLTDKNGNIVKSSLFAGKTIDVKGVVDYFSGSYQIKVYSLDDITIH